ncbi:MAG: T9SS type A sorting domain-containing protein [Bacteroidales bacterium]|nr:T9SS type A sorting domain-containing protein [Bacteroidales bacterium]
MKKITLLIIGLLLTSIVFSQTANPELVGSAGESFNNSTYQLDWSIGEFATATYSTGNYVITQGLHQNNYVITSVENMAREINISAYPNPTTDLISIFFADLLSSIEHGNVMIVTDINGKVLQQVEVINEVEQLNFSNYANGIYFLTVKQLNQVIKSFKIIKK